MTDEALKAFIEAGTGRIEAVELDGRTVWIKRPEALGPWMRLLKGDPERAFAREIASHQAMARKGLPVAPILSAGPDHIATEDSGPTLLPAIRNWSDDSIAPLQHAALALADLHDQGEAHGRPSMKDICWKDGQITFIDFERRGREGNLARAQEMDALMFTFNVCAESGGALEPMTLARDTYRKAQPQIWTRAEKRLRRFLPLKWALTPLIPFLGGRDFPAIKPFFRFMLDKPNSP